MYAYKKSYTIVLLSFLMITAPAVHAVPNDMELVAVPTITGVLSGYVYGLMLQRSLLGLLLSNIFFGRCKDRIFASFDKNYSAQTANASSGISVICESKTVSNGTQRATYVINVGDDKDGAKTSKYSAMSDFDDLVTLATMLAVMLGRG